MTKKKLSVTAVIPCLNSQTTLLKVLESITKQNYLINEIIIVDNHSRDNTLKIASNFKKKNKAMPIKIITRDKTYTPGSSYNLAINCAKTELVIALHSDSVLPTAHEIKRLVEPFSDVSVVASYSIVEHPKKVWESYNFWQKCQFVHVMGTAQPAMLGKFDCYRRSAYLKIGGFDDKNFIPGIGSEDADLHYRLRKIGKVVSTKARVIHLHYLGKNYSLKDWILNKKLMARTYGRLLRNNWKDLKHESIFFLIKPFLAFSTIIPIVNMITIPLAVGFSFYYMRKMYIEPSTHSNWRIITLPFITLLMLYYETFWMFEALLFLRKRV